MSRAEKIMDMIADDSSCLNRGARIIIAACTITVVLLVLLKFIAGTWSM